MPIVVLTIEEQTAVMERFLEAGADDYAVKPIKPVDLVSLHQYPSALPRERAVLL